MLHRQDARGQMGPEQAEPVGILFHTSESDVWPMDESNNERLRVSSQRLLTYIQRKRLYHYVIDRFGRVFRVMNDASKANHAGFSIWRRGDDVYLNLNHAFLGICFETRWESGPWFVRSERMYLIPGDSALGYRLPVTEKADRPRQVMLYALWDFADGGLLEGW